MFCPNCGKQVEDSSGICGKCGAPIALKKQVVASSKQADNPPSARCSVGDLERAFQMSFNMMKQRGAQTDILAALDAIIATLKVSFNEQAVGYCIGKYIDAELDYSTSGPRGLGRVSTYVPRLGAHYRKQLAGLSPADRDLLFELIKNMMLQGYLTFTLLEFKAGGALADAVTTDSEDLFQAWIPLIYSYDFGGIDEVLGNFTYSGWEKIEAFFDKHKMKVGNRKTKEILTYYMLAGLALRQVEVTQIRN